MHGQETMEGPAEAVVHRTGGVQQNNLRPEIIAQGQSTYNKLQVACTRKRDLNKDPHTQPSEPILFPKLRIQFADFPYLL